MSNSWMIRAGEGGFLAERFAKGIVAIGWELGDLTEVRSREELARMYSEVYRAKKAGAVANEVAMIWKFRHDIKTGERVVTYDTAKREYVLGKIDGDYYYDASQPDEYRHLRKAEWQHRISRDALKVSSKNSLGSTLTIFKVDNEVLADLLSAAEKPKGQTSVDVEAEKEGLEQIREDTIAKAHELIKDKLLQLSDEELPRLVAAILRAMGFKTRVSPRGPDRGVDVIASPDGLGLVEPRIKTQVKHRPDTAMGSQELRSFLGALRAGDKGLYVSTGGFSKDANYEAERATVPITLVDLDDLARLVVEHYDRIDPEGQALLPLVRIYWPEE